jgi:hypothetical protein
MAGRAQELTLPSAAGRSIGDNPGSPHHGVHPSGADLLVHATN